MSLTSVFTAIANAIRTKGGTSATMTPAEMPQAIADLPSGGSYDWVFGQGNDWPSVIDLGITYTSGGATQYARTKLPWGKLNFLGVPAEQMSDDGRVNYRTEWEPPIDKIILPPDTPIDAGSSSSQFVNVGICAKEIEFPTGVQRLGVLTGGSSSYAVFMSPIVSHFDIPSTVQIIGHYAFRMLSGIYTKWMKIRSPEIRENAFYYCKPAGAVLWGTGGAETVSASSYGHTIPIWFSNDVTTIYASGSTSCPFNYSLADAVELYCEATAQPSGWGPYWNKTNSNTYTVHWGVTEEDFNEIVGISA